MSFAYHNTFVLRDEIDTKNCSLRDGRFLCNDRLRCLSLDYTCDGVCNCFDCSDETGLCSQFGDDRILRACSDFHLATPQGHRCPCSKPTTKSSRNNTSCIDIEIKNCTNENICDQKCYRYKGRAQCSCSAEYITIPHDDNGFRCQSKKSSKHTLIYSTTSQIKLLNLTSSDVQVIKKPIECGLVTAVRDYVYYTSYSNENKIIFRHSLKSKMTTQVFQSNSSIMSMAIDYIADNLYFTTNATLSVCSAKMEYKICTQLKCCDVKYITLAPNYGLMFYTKISPSNRDACFIMISNMDGSSENILVDGTFHISTPMATDESIKRLYWFDADDKKLFSVSFSGGYNELRSFQSSEPMVSIAAFDSKVYFTKHHDNKIYILENYERFIKSNNKNIKLNLYNDDSFKPSFSLVNSKVHFIDRNFTFFIKSIFVYNPDQQRHRQTKNPCENTSCSGICLLRSTYTTNNSSYNCICNGTASTNNVYRCNHAAKVSPNTGNTLANVSQSHKPLNTTSFAQTTNKEKFNKGIAVPKPSQATNKIDTTTKIPSLSTTILVPNPHSQITTIPYAHSTHTKATTIITHPDTTSTTKIQSNSENAQIIIQSTTATSTTLGNPTKKSKDQNSTYKTIWFSVTILLIVALTIVAYFGHRRYRYNRSTTTTNGGQTSYTTLLIDDHEL